MIGFTGRVLDVVLPDDPDQLAAAHQLIAPHIRRTPVLAVGDDLVAGVDIVLKLELFQHAGSFKPRGAFHLALSQVSPPRRVVAASGGNHGIAVAHVAAALGIDAEVFVPAISAPVKRERIAALGATVRVVGQVYDDAQAAADERAAETGALVVHPFDLPEIVQGQASMGREIAEQVPDADAVAVAVGGGGLFAGVVAARTGATRIVPVEPGAAPTLAGALAAGEPVPVEVGGVAADSLGARRIGRHAFAAAQASGIEPLVAVTDDDIVAAQRLLWERTRILAEPGGATALAGVLAARHRFVGHRVVVVVCGGNVDPATLG